MEPTHVVRGVSRLTGRLLPSPQPGTLGTSLAQYRRQIARGFRQKNVQKQFSISVRKAYPNSKCAVPSKWSTSRNKSSLSVKSTLIQKDPVTGKIVSTIERSKQRPSTAVTGTRRSVDDVPSVYSPGSSTTSMKRPNTAGFFRADPQHGPGPVLKSGIERPTSASLSHMKERNKNFENMTKNIVDAHREKTMEALYPLSIGEPNGERSKGKELSATQCRLLSPSRNKPRPVSAGALTKPIHKSRNSTWKKTWNNRPQTAGNLGLACNLDAGGSALSAVPANVSVADQPRVETTSKKVRDYERPWTACAGSSSRSIARSKLRKRPKTSVGSRLETAAYWGNMAKGHFSSVELAGKMLPNRDSIASPPIVVGLDKAPKDFQFKVPLHPMSKSIPSEYAEYDLHGRKVIPKALHAEETLTTLSEEESAVFIPGENKKKVTAFFNSDYFALRRRGSGMIRASVIIPHQFIGNAGFVVGHHVVSVDAVDYNASDGCRMYVTMKPGDDIKLAKALLKITKGRHRIDVTPKQYHRDWSYYPFKEVTPEEVYNRDNGDNIAAGVTFLKAQESTFSDKASTMLREETMPQLSKALSSEEQKQKFLDTVCNLAQKGWLVKLKEMLRGCEEAVHWARKLDGRTALHCSAMTGQISTLKFLLNELRCSRDKRDLKGQTPYDLACLTIKRTPKSHPRMNQFRKARAMTSCASIYESAKIGDYDRVEYLLEANPSNAIASNVYGMTAMHFAVMNDFVDIADIVAQVGGTEVWARRNNTGQTPLDLAHGNDQLLLLHKMCCADDISRLNASRKKSKRDYFELLRKQKDEKYVKEHLRGTSAAVVHKYHTEMRDNSSAGGRKTKSTSLPKSVSTRIKTMKSTASALDLSICEKPKKKHLKKMVEKKPWWQKSTTTKAFSPEDLDMPAANSREFDKFINSHYNMRSI